MSKASDAKKARRRKRKAGGDSRWIPEEVIDQLSAIQDAVVADLGAFDERITGRGWTFDEEESGDQHAVWFYEPSGAEVDEGITVTTAWLDADEDGAVVHVVLVGTRKQQMLTQDEFFEQLDVIEAYRNGAPAV